MRFGLTRIDKDAPMLVDENESRARFADVIRTVLIAVVAGAAFWYGYHISAQVAR